ncbi:MAG: PLP-dependent aminotransferase family protein [bacterium]|nr:PLP-dependent aminotransferase family protein [bacterium]MDT8365391.1 PLP-dependent aminotransferase family protein [bacterium]
MQKTELTDSQRTPLYEQVAGQIASLVERGTYRPGDRIPSIRKLSRQMKVSVNTIREAYGYLEVRRIIEARPQSGYYVCSSLPEVPAEPEFENREIHPTDVGVGELAEMVMRDTANSDLIQFGASIPDPTLLPIDRLNRMLSSEVRRRPIVSVSYSLPPGYERLRKQIAKRMVNSGCMVGPEDIVITNGCMEAVTLALLATCKPGDTLAVESPTYYGFFQLIHQMGLKALEIPSTPTSGISIEALTYALETTRVNACLVVPNYSNPIGSIMPHDRKLQLVRLLEQHSIPLIEDDINSDLSHSDEPPTTAKGHDRTGNVLLCSSYTKTLAPGYRVGWMVPGRYQAQVQRLKLLMNIGNATPPQMAIAEFLISGGYERHLRNIRRTYAKRVAMLGEAIGRHFPEGTRVTRPRGGFNLWVEMNEKVQALNLYKDAMKHGITITPGPLFTASDKFHNCVRLNAAFYSERTELAVETLGKLAKKF